MLCSCLHTAPTSIPFKKCGAKSKRISEVGSLDPEGVVEAIAMAFDAVTPADAAEWLSSCYITESHS